MGKPTRLSHRLIAAVAASTLLAISAYSSHAQPLAPPTGNVPFSSVTLEQAHGLLAAQKAVVFDIREPHEHARGVAPDMRLLPMSQLKQRMHEIPKDRPVLVICSTQNRSFETQKMLQAAGWNNVRYVEDGMNGWAQHGWPLVGLPAS